MSELWHFFEQENWEYFRKHVVEQELPKNLHFYKELEPYSPFDDDINRALASLSFYLFRKDIKKFIKWLDKKIPALYNKTPREISQQKNGMDCIREFILRSK